MQEPDFSRVVAQRIMHLRRKDETWSRFAERIGIGRQVVGNWRAKGKRNITGASLEAFAAAVHAGRANPYYLLFGEGPPELVEPGKAEEALVQIMELARAVLRPDEGGGAAGEKATPDSDGPTPATGPGAQRPTVLDPDTLRGSEDGTAVAGDSARRRQPPKPRDKRTPRKRRGRGKGGGR